MSLHSGDLCLRLAKIAAVDYTVWGGWRQNEQSALRTGSGPNSPSRLAPDPDLIKRVDPNEVRIGRQKNQNKYAPIGAYLELQSNGSRDILSGECNYRSICCQAAGLGSNTYLYLYLYLNTQISVFVFVFENPQDEIFVFVFVFDWRIWKIFFKYNFLFHTLIHNDDNNDKYNILYIS